MGVTINPFSRLNWLRETSFAELRSGVARCIYYAAALPASSPSWRRLARNRVSA